MIDNSRPNQRCDSVIHARNGASEISSEHFKWLLHNDLHRHNNSGSRDTRGLDGEPAACTGQSTGGRRAARMRRPATKKTRRSAKWKHLRDASMLGSGVAQLGDAASFPPKTGVRDFTPPGRKADTARELRGFLDVPQACVAIAGPRRRRSRVTPAAAARERDQSRDDSEDDDDARDAQTQPEIPF